MKKILCFLGFHDFETKAGVLYKHNGIEIIEYKCNCVYCRKEKFIPSKILKYEHK